MVEDREDYEEVVTIKGSDGTDLVTVKLDANGNIVAVMKGDYDGALQTIKLDSEHRMLARVLPVIEGVVLDKGDETIGVSANGSVYSDAVPAGKRWRMTHIEMYNETHITEQLSFYIKRGLEVYTIFFRHNMPANVGLMWQGEIWLDAGDRLQFYFYQGQQNDVIHASWNGAEYTSEF